MQGIQGPQGNPGTPATLGPTLTTIEALTGLVDTLLYFTGTDVAALATLTALARTLLAGATTAAMQSTLALVPGTHVQAQDAELQAIAGLTSAANRFPYFTGSGTAALAVFEEQTFTATGTGFTTTVTGTARYVRVGNHITLRLPSLTGTSNASTFTVTGLPAGIAVASQIYQMVLVQNAGAYQTGMIRLGGTTIELWATSGFTGFATSGVKTLFDVIIPYLLV
jgi:hypothetical protein